jgi:gluconolactonase
MKPRPLHLLISCLLIAFTASPVRSQIVSPDAELSLISDQFKFTEGPTADSDGNVLFTDQPNDQIVRYDFQTNEISTWLKPAGRSNGLFFTDPLYKRPYWTQEIADDHPRGVYRVTHDGQVTQVAGDLLQPNGIIGDPKQRILYVADISDGKTYRYRIAEDGTLQEKTLFCEMGSDGMTIDRKGNVYLTGRGVTVFNPNGEKITNITVPRGWTANVTFAGPERRHLFITAGDSVFVIKTEMQGL